MRRAQGEHQRLERGLNEEMPADVNSLIDAKKVCVSEVCYGWSLRLCV